HAASTMSATALLCLIARDPITAGYAADVLFLSLRDRVLDRVLYRRPFEGASARRYARAERPAFGDLDDRLLDRLDLTGARRLLDLGAGPGTFAARAAARFPRLSVIAVEPSRDFRASVRARGEALPLADAAIDVAIMLSA